MSSKTWNLCMEDATTRRVFVTLIYPFVLLAWLYSVIYEDVDLGFIEMHKEIWGQQ